MVALTNRPNQDGFLIGGAFQRLGYYVHYFDYERDNPETLVRMGRSLRPEIVFVTKGKGLGNATLRQLKQNTERLVMWYPDAYLPEDHGFGHEFLAGILPEFDVALITCRGLVGPLTRYNKECHFAPAFYDNHYFRLDSISETDRQTFGCDAVFVGNNQKVYGRERLVALKAAAKVCRLRIWGLGWGIPVPRALIAIARTGMPATPNSQSIRLRIWNLLLKAKPPVRASAFSKAVMARELGDSSVSKAYQCSKIGLNAGTYHLSHGSIDMGFSDRLYECMGNRTLYLTPPIVNIGEWFEEGREIMSYRTVHELTRKVRYLLENDSEVKRIAARGYEKIMRFHTIDVRILQYLDLIYGRSCPFDCKHEVETAGK